MAILKNTIIQDTSGIKLPSGTTAQRPTAVQGQLRLNTDAGILEDYNGNGWTRNSDWVISRTYRTAPTYTPQVLIQVESAGSNNGSPGYRQFIQINGTTVLDANAPRSYRITKLRKDTNGFWTYIASNGYDVYGLQTDADAARVFLEGFVNGEMLILNTWDEPNNRRSQLLPVLKDSFGSTIEAYRSFWAFRDSHLLISIKGANKPLFEEHRTTSIPGSNVSMWLP